jgi:hypothetical protein
MFPPKRKTVQIDRQTFDVDNLLVDEQDPDKDVSGYRVQIVMDLGDLGIVVARTIPAE